MKIILSFLFLSISVIAAAQRGGVTESELKKLVGSWAGTLTYTDYSDDKTQSTLPAKLEIVDLKDSLGFNYTYTEPNGKLVTDKSSLRFYTEGDKLGIDGETWFLSEVRRRGIRLTLIADKDATDNNKEAEIRKIITIGPSTLNIIKQVKYKGAKDYFIRNKTELQKK